MANAKNDGSSDDGDRSSGGQSTGPASNGAAAAAASVDSPSSNGVKHHPQKVAGGVGSGGGKGPATNKKPKAPPKPLSLNLDIANGHPHTHSSTKSSAATAKSMTKSKPNVVCSSAKDGKVLPDCVHPPSQNGHSSNTHQNGHNTNSAINGHSNSNAKNGHTATEPTDSTDEEEELQDPFQDDENDPEHNEDNLEDHNEDGDAQKTSSGSGEDQEDGAVSPLSPPKTPTKGYNQKSPRRRTRTMSTSSSAQSSQIVRAGARTIYTAGRPPWYDTHGQLTEAFVIGICGGSASGKTTVAKRIIEALDVQWVSLLSMDSFYKNFNEEERALAAQNEYNFDHPDAFDYELLIETLGRLKEGKSVEVPIYNFKTHSREKQKKTIYGANVVIFEGILAFANKDLLPLLDMKIFVDTDSDIRLARRMKRDISERGRAIEGVLKQYNKFVKPSFEHYIEPTMSYADIIVPRGGENEIALNLIVNHVHQQLTQRGFKVRCHLKKSAHEGQPLPDSLHVLEATKQVMGLHCFIRNKDTSRDEFIFYSKRLMRLLIEFALSLLSFRDVTVDTPQGVQYQGKRSNIKTICGVSVLRAGETMEPALSEVVKDIRLGKILIQTNHDTGEPELHYLRLPKDIKEHHVMVMDATVATGAAAMMAIRVLLDHDVPEENIMLLSLIMAESGVHSVAYAFPKVRLITTAVDPEVNDSFHILPGIGNFGDRYFGTEVEHGAILKNHTKS